MDLPKLGDRLEMRLSVLGIENYLSALTDNIPLSVHAFIFNYFIVHQIVGTLFSVGLVHGKYNRLEESQTNL